MRDEASDEALLKQAASGDLQAKRACAERHLGPIRRLTRAMLGNTSAADDAAQEAMARALSALHRYEPSQGSPRTWCLSIARNVALEMLRNQQRVTPASTSADEESAEASLLTLARDAGWGEAESPEAVALRHEQQELVVQALASLPPADREVLVLRDLEGVAGEEAARVLGIDLRAMKSRLHRARLRLVGVLRAAQRAQKLENGMAVDRFVGGLRCSEVLEVLSEYFDKDLAPTARAQVESHVRQCTVCERFGGQFSQSVHALREALRATPASDDALLASLRAHFT